MNAMTFLTIPSSAVLLEIIQGSLVWIAFIISGGGIIAQSFRLLKMTRKQAMPQLSSNAQYASQTAATAKNVWRHRLSVLKISILETNPAMATVSFIFHVCLFMAPMFLLAHNILLDLAFEVSFVSFSEKMSDSMTVVIIACGFFFFLRRIFVRRVRIITTVYDYMFLFIAVSPFLTGFLAYHHIFNYHLMIVLHILSGELMLVMLPFSKFFHMIFFFISRFMIISEHSMGSPKRLWQY